MHIRTADAVLLLLFAAIVLTSGWVQLATPYEGQQNGSFVFLPVIGGQRVGGTIPPLPGPTSTNYEFNRAILQRCHPNAGVTYVEGTTYQNGQPVDGYQVVFSYAPDGPIVAQVQSGPHEGYPNWNTGFYSHIIEPSGPRQGTWFFWIVDGSGKRISAIAQVHTDGSAEAGKCQQAVIDFDS